MWSVTRLWLLQFHVIQFILRDSQRCGSPSKMTIKDRTVQFNSADEASAPRTNNLRLFGDRSRKLTRMQARQNHNIIHANFAQFPRRLKWTECA
jgi:hypothetical protein